MSEANVILRGKTIEISFPYSIDTIDIVRGIDGRKWDPSMKLWKVPATPWHAQQVLTKLPGFYIDPAISRMADKQALPPKLELPNGLYDFQKDGVKFIIGASGRCIIADEMGLGKTIEALAYVQMFGGKALIISPANVVFKWMNEVQKWIPDRTVAVILTGAEDIPDCDIVIMSYAIMTLQHSRLNKIPFDIAIMDESHYLKNPKAKRTRVAKSLVESGLSKILFLSGTPFMNRPAEMFSLLNMLDPVGFSNYWSYVQRYCGAMRVNGVWLFPPNVVTNVDELTKRLERYMIRRTKREVALELPDLSRSFVPVTIPDMASYNSALKDITKWLRSKDKNVKNPAHVLTRLGVLRQIVGEGKVSAAVELAESILESDRKVVLFAHHRDVVLDLFRKLKDWGVRIIDGSTKQEDRQKFSQEFLISNSPIRVMIMSVAGAEGLDLYSASDIIFVEREWTPAREEQAEARLHRIGQKNAVTAHYIIAKGTLDERLNKIIQDKRSVFGQVIRQDEIVEVLKDELLGGMFN